MNDFIIPFVFDNWSDEYQWWVPNTVPPDFVVDGKRQPPFTHGSHWFNHDLHSVMTDFNDVDLLKNYSAAKFDQLSNYKNIRYFSKSELSDSKKYIFPVLIGAFGYFTAHEHIGFSLVSKQVLNDVRNNRAKIVLMFPLEGCCGQEELHGRDFDILDQWCKDSGLTKNQVYFIHGNFKFKEPTNFTYVPVQAFYCWLETQVTGITEYCPVDNKNLFLLYNRRSDWHRLLFVCEIINNNLLDRGLVSYLGKAEHVKDQTNVQLIHPRPDLEDAAGILDTLIPMELDIELEFNNPVNNIVIPHHEHTFLSIVSETLFRPGTIFYSEKTWKPILAGQPFMHVATTGTLAELRRQGYRTFGQWWDESYDDEPDLDKRIKMIIQELVKLSKLDVSELINIRNSMRSTLEHNQQLFNHRRTLCSGSRDEYLYQEIKKIWNSF